VKREPLVFVGTCDLAGLSEADTCARYAEIY
jgi:hypothetical protein